MPRKTVAAVRPGVGSTGFNEAAARCRGKRIGLPPSPTSPTCFNEAAARCRGKHFGPESFFMHLSRFNEAAARCRGKLGKAVQRNVVIALQ